LADQLITKRRGLIPEPVIVKTERRWFLAMAAMLGVMLAVIVLTASDNAASLSDVETIDPRLCTCRGVCRKQSWLRPRT